MHEVVSGGGVWCESASAMVSNCVLTGNAAQYGGGAYWGTLAHCAISQNHAYSGGGAMRSILNDCLLMGNTASQGGAAHEAILNRCQLSYNSAGLGGGVTRSSLDRCTISFNHAEESGGGANWSVMTNCLLYENSAAFGGGAFGGDIINCTLFLNRASVRGGGVWLKATKFGLVRYGCISAGCYPNPGCSDCFLATGIVSNSIISANIAPEDANYAEEKSEGPGTYQGTLFFSCTTPLPANTNDFGNITNEPGLFVRFSDGILSGFGGLTSNSPCINAGRNAYTPMGLDYAGDPRIVGGTVDMGASEFQTPQSIISYAWLQQYGLPTDGSVDFSDPDRDGQNNWQEWRAWTDPTNSGSALRLLTPQVSPNGLIVRWQSVSDQYYFLERGSSLAANPSFVPFVSNIVGQADTTVFTDTNAVGVGPLFYRVGVDE